MLNGNMTPLYEKGFRVEMKNSTMHKKVYPVITNITFDKKRNDFVYQINKGQFYDKKNFGIIISKSNIKVMNKLMK